MAIQATNTAWAYVNHGRWVAECPVDCGGAVSLEPNQPLMHCTECKNIAPVQWPSEAQEIWDALSERPIPRTRNWFPKGHTLALRAHCPSGETAAELQFETKAHAEEGTSQFWSTNYDKGEVL